jgi:hypothetical protein
MTTRHLRFPRLSDYTVIALLFTAQIVLGGFAGMYLMGS